MDEEIEKFLGLNIRIGLVKLGKSANYWSTNPLYKNEVASKTISQNRFQSLLTNIHFADNEAIQPDNRLGKIQTLIDKMQRKFQELYTPEESIVIDESLIPWSGRLVFRHYIPAKAYKYGIKVFKLCSSEGYVWSLQGYRGKNASSG
ncbi:piggyBac transposable element-derived protein 4-like [Limulus polyphemus]|uniref:PiggyBac transposable element-derived protein 4-like n=1 Tax=Limulus polyphemus TaxID=6850 RepID=A0ABM1BNI1_LIMPO|nr:piggyBac transposable element-derived protein 4-like [Limulus polyphemus]